MPVAPADVIDEVTRRQLERVSRKRAMEARVYACAESGLKRIMMPSGFGIGRDLLLIRTSMPSISYARNDSNT